MIIKKSYFSNDRRLLFSATLSTNHTTLERLIFKTQSITSKQQWVAQSNGQKNFIEFVKINMLHKRSYLLSDRKLEKNSSDTSCGNATSRDTKSRSREGGAPSRVDARNGLKCFSEGIEAVGRKRRRRDA